MAWFVSSKFKQFAALRRSFSYSFIENRKVNILKPITFTVLFCGASFGAAAVYDSYQKPKRLVFDLFNREIVRNKETSWFDHYLVIIRRFIGMRDQLSQGESTISKIIIFNTGVFGMWAIANKLRSGNVLNRFMNYVFLHNPFNNSFVPLIGSMFSHITGMHYCFNNYALWSFGPYIHDRYFHTPWHFLAFYLSAGVFSNAFSLMVQAVRGSYFPSLGASGAIYACLALLACQEPDVKILLFFVIPMTLGVGMTGLVAFDIAGLFLKFSKLDHAGIIIKQLCY